MTRHRMAALLLKEWIDPPETQGRWCRSPSWPS